MSKKINYAQIASVAATPQSEPIPGSSQVPNNAGGYAWQVDIWTLLDRFLILGTEGGTFYVDERKLTLDAAKAVSQCIQEDGPRTVRRIVEISDAGRAAKNDPALFALAMCCSAKDSETRSLALRALPDVARTGTHLFTFLAYIQELRGWGRALRHAIADWYQRDPAKIAYQAVKYRQRDGWTHRDALRLAHPKARTSTSQDLFHWIVTQDAVEIMKKDGEPDSADPLRIVKGFIWAQGPRVTPKEAAALIREYKLPREALPTDMLKTPEVWEALLEDMPLTALIRNLGNMGKCGLLAPMSDASGEIVQRLGFVEALRHSRIHPIGILAALLTYGQGHGARGHGEWQAVSTVMDALETAFYASFQNIEPSGKRTLLALDVSPSMAAGEIAAVPGLTPAMGAAAMALATARTETNYQIMAFCHELVKLPISAHTSLREAMHLSQQSSWGGTDCALPMQYALQNQIPIDLFAVYTDNETWTGGQHPQQALQQYRRQMNIPAKLVVVAMTANGPTIGDPDDPGVLNVVGFDTATPQAIAEFAKL